ncbi:DEHA2E12386p [Debaryomyces hansenii CBS767]|uniref:DEHA2E12386p n=1 Tax=Debaryomyces hansenii (strain ATCC 36239 / CBS 767 / BCRC 21394 / JCM 1990 / NBRC 0083 / IGC 2968) TaxID=284592 RepID=B5RTZ6_DEBHA|nr:DEHA2E12386p [Debaryomyces hansenii CBS767]CAR65808.1 DEHA2E12386p [Debaryomyces hansenii CBS767]|eukprot:XP_002770465.1 DEHA2E12386p [Debaryomyces hansenii CBS767]
MMLAPITNIKILTIDSTIIEHPPNGQKRWRITSRKSNSSTIGSKNSKIPKSQRVIQCLQNSLQIAAAGQQYQGKMPPSKRPKNKPGMPKDFIFVDLSPVKNAEDSSDEGDNSSLVSPTITPDTTALDKQELITVSPVTTPDTTIDKHESNTVSPSIAPDSTALDKQKSTADSYFELSASNDSFQSSQSDEESIFSLGDSSVLSKSSTFGTESYIQDYNQINSQSSASNDAMLGLGILNMDMSSNAGHWIAESGDMYYQESFNYEPSVAYNSHINPFPVIEQSKIEPQFEGLKRSSTVPELPTQVQQPTSHRRAKSTCEPSKKRSSSTLQFRVYKAPSSKGKKSSTPELNHRRTISEPSFAVPRNSNAFDFMDFDNQMFVDLNGDDSPGNCNSVMSESNIFTPSTEYSESEDYTSGLLKSSNMDTFSLGGCGSNEFLGSNQFDFDFNSYVSY